MNNFLLYLQKYFEQKKGLSFSRQILLFAKIIEFMLRKITNKTFVMRDIWGILHRYSNDDDIMGFKIAVGVYELEEHVGGALEEPKAAEVSRCILEIG